MHCGGWQVQNLQGEVAGWKSREEVLMLLFKSKVTVLAEFPSSGRLVLSIKGFNLLDKTYLIQLLYSIICLTQSLLI